MSRYIVNVGGERETKLAIEADSFAEAVRYALAAMQQFLATKQPPPERIRIVVTDVVQHTFATIVFTAIM